MKRLVLLFALFISGLCCVIVPSAIADKPPAPPGQGECNHGNSNEPCKPDPSTNGKDCESHGNNGGVNEDHCLATTTTIPTDSTTTTTATTTDSTTTATTSTNQTTTRETTSTSTETIPQTTSTLTGTSEPNTTTVGTTTVGTTTVGTTTTSVEGTTTTSPTPDPASSLKQGKKTQKAHVAKAYVVKGELPYTGMSGMSLLLVGLMSIMMIGTGIYLRRKGRNGNT